MILRLSSLKSHFTVNNFPLVNELSIDKIETSLLSRKLYSHQFFFVIIFEQLLEETQLSSGMLEAHDTHFPAPVCNH